MFAQGVGNAITTGIYRDNATDAERELYMLQLGKAWEAFGEHRYWKTRTLLASAPMMNVYKKSGRLPEGQVVTQFPDMLQYKPGDRYLPDFPLIDAKALKEYLSGEANVETVKSETFNPEWTGQDVLLSRDGKLSFRLPLSAPGPYRMTIGHVSKTPGVITAAVDGQSLPVPMVTEKVDVPEQTAFPIIQLKGGNVELLLSKGGEFGIYALQFEPVLRPLPTTLWSTIGPFRSFWEQGGANQTAVKDGFAKEYPPQKDISPDKSCETRDGDRRQWQQTGKIVGSHADVGVNFAFRCKSGSFDICFASTYITSPDDRNVLLYIGTDWWATAYVNGEEVVCEDPKPKEEFNCAFNRWKPKYAVIKLKKGLNTILVKNHGGSANNWFSAFISDQPDLSFSPIPKTPSEK